MSYSASTSPGSGEHIAAIGDLELCYETFGERSDPALVLIMGLATQMIGWRVGFCESLAARGSSLSASTIATRALHSAR